MSTLPTCNGSDDAVESPCSAQPSRHEEQFQRQPSKCALGDKDHPSDSVNAKFDVQISSNGETTCAIGDSASWQGWAELENDPVGPIHSKLLHRAY